MWTISEKRVLGIMWWEWMRAVLFSAISAWKPGLEMLFSHAAGLCSGWLLEENLPKLGQAAQKQMRSDTGAKEYLPEPPQAHITKCSALRLLCSVSTLHVEITDMKTGNRDVKIQWMDVCIFIFVFIYGGRWIEKLVCLRSDSICCGLSMSCVYFFHFTHLCLIAGWVIHMEALTGNILLIS